MKQPKISIIIIYGNISNKADDIISSLNNQTFDDYEVIFVNCAADEKSISAISMAVKKNEKINMLTLPNNKDYEFAKNSGLEIVSGNYVCFIDACENLVPDFIENIYYSNLKQDKFKIKTENNRLYKRSFIENHTDINEIIKYRVEEEVKQFLRKIDENENFVKAQLDDYYKNSDNTLNNRIYNINTRFSALENFVSEKENQINEKLNKLSEKVYEDFNIKPCIFQSDIEKIYGYIETKISEKNHDIGGIYEEIAKKSEFYGTIIEENKNNLNYEISSIKEKIDNLYNEQEIKYNCLKNMIKTIKDDLYAKFEALSLMSDSENIDKVNKVADLVNLEKNMNMNFDRIYSYINEKNAAFYEELTAFYKEINEKINK